MGGTLLVILALLVGRGTSAQIIRDGTIGPGGREVLSGENLEIGPERGEAAGANLFHSFEQFSFGDAIRSVTFTTEASYGTRNVVARVTGPFESRIDGTLRSPSASLYLVNPHGVLFGGNASVDVNGSFSVSTADRLFFGDGEARVALDTEATRPTILSAADPSAFGFLGRPAPIGLEAGGRLAVSAPGANLSLVGGDLEIDGVVQSSTAFDGEATATHLAALSSAGTAEIAGLERVRAEFAELGSVRIQGSVEAIGSSPTVFVRGKTVTLAGRAHEENETIRGLTSNYPGAAIHTETVGGVGGGVDIAGGEVLLTEQAVIRAWNRFEGAGQRATLDVDRLRIEGAAQVDAASMSGGDSGGVEIRAREYAVIAPGEKANTIAGNNVRGGIFADAREGGRGGRISVDTPHLVLAERGVLTAHTKDTGDAGSVFVHAGRVEITGLGGIHADNIADHAGRPGSIEIFVDGDALIADRWNEGSGFTQSGITAKAHDESGTDGIRVVVEGTLTVRDASVSTDTTGEANAQPITIKAGHLLLLDGGQIVANAYGKGAAGEITIDTAQAVLLSGRSATETTYHRSAIAAESFAEGSGGSVRMTAPDLRVGPGIIGVGAGGDGDAGLVRLDVARLLLHDEGVLDARTTGGGAAGRIEVRATESVVIEDPEIPEDFTRDTGMDASAEESGSAGNIRVETPDLRMSGGSITASSRPSPYEPIATGDGGRVEISAGRVSLTAGAVIQSATSTFGNAGSVAISASESVTVSGRMAGGRPSSINVEAGRPELGGTGRAGSLSVSTSQLLVSDGGEIRSSSVLAGEAGGIEIDADRVSVESGGRIDSSSEGAGAGPGGTIAIEADETSVRGSGSAVATRTSSGSTGGSVSIRGGRIVVSEGGSIAASTSGAGRGGDVAMEGRKILVAAGGRIDSGSETAGAGAGGSVTLAAEDMRLTGDGSGVFAQTASASPGGAIAIRGGDLEVDDGAAVSSSSSGSGDAGDVSIELSGSLAMRDASITTDAPSADGGNIAIQVADRLTLADSEISANVGGGVGGNITIDPVLVFLDGSRILAQAREGQGGRIQISARVFLASVDSLVSASSALGIDGSVTIRAPDTDLSGTLSPLPESFLDAATQMRAQCAARARDQGGSFAVRGRDGPPASPDDPLPAGTPTEVMRELDSPTALDERAIGRDDLAGAILREPASGEAVGLLVGCRA